MKKLYISDYIAYIGENKDENHLLVSNARINCYFNDIWIHISDYPSAHCIIRNPNNDRIPNCILKRCALEIKRNNNKCKSIQKLMFDIVKIKYVKPTNNIGEVEILSNCKNIKI
tara:strand:- start:590 stop:931 length:342 start_codon:yes stop_codon:yes gene_type:complete